MRSPCCDIHDSLILQLYDPDRNGLYPRATLVALGPNLTKVTPPPGVDLIVFCNRQRVPGSRSDFLPLELPPSLMIRDGHQPRPLAILVSISAELAVVVQAPRQERPVLREGEIVVTARRYLGHLPVLERGNVLGEHPVHVVIQA